MSEKATGKHGGRPIDQDLGKRLLLVLCLGMELCMIVVGLWPAAWFVMTLAPLASASGHWVLIILGATLIFNFGYLVGLLIFRILVPYPAEGLHAMPAEGRMPPVFIHFMLNILLVKAREEPPWASMFSAVLARIWPLDPLFRRLFGPHTTSTTLGDTVRFIDPYFIEAGKNVEFGFGCTLVAHHFDNRGLLIKKVKIGDHVVIGGASTIMAGVEIGDHAVVGNRSVVKPNTKIGPYEFWAGSPAVKIKDLRDESRDLDVAPQQK